MIKLEKIFCSNLKIVKKYLILSKKRVFFYIGLSFKWCRQQVYLGGSKE